MLKNMVKQSFKPILKYVENECGIEFKEINKIIENSRVEEQFENGIIKSINFSSKYGDFFRFIITDDEIKFTYTDVNKIANYIYENILKSDNVIDFDIGPFIIKDISKFYPKLQNHMFVIRIYEHGFGLYDNLKNKYVRSMKMDENKNIKTITDIILKLLSKLNEISILIEENTIVNYLKHNKYTSYRINKDLNKKYLPELLYLVREIKYGDKDIYWFKITFNTDKIVCERSINKFPNYFPYDRVEVDSIKEFVDMLKKYKNFNKI